MVDLNAGVVVLALIVIGAALFGAAVAAMADCPKTHKAFLWVAALFAAPVLCKVWLALVL